MPFGRCEDRLGRSWPRESDDRLGRAWPQDAGAFPSSASSHVSLYLKRDTRPVTEGGSASPAPPRLSYPREFLSAEVHRQVPWGSVERRLTPPRRVQDLRDVASAQPSSLHSGYPPNPFLRYTASDRAPTPSAEATAASGSSLREVYRPDLRSHDWTTPPSSHRMEPATGSRDTPLQQGAGRWQQPDLAQSIDGLKQDGIERLKRLEDGLTAIRSELAELCGRRATARSVGHREELEAALMELRPACEELENVELLARTAAQRCERHGGAGTHEGVGALQEAERVRQDRLSSLEAELRRLLLLEAELPKAKSDLARAVLKEQTVLEELATAREQSKAERGHSSCSTGSLQLVDVKGKIQRVDEELRWHRDTLELKREELNQANRAQAQHSFGSNSDAAIAASLQLERERVSALEVEFQRLQPLERQLLETNQELARVADEGRRSNEELVHARGQLSAAEAHWMQLREELACAQGELERRSADRAAAAAATASVESQRCPEQEFQASGPGRPSDSEEAAHRLQTADSGSDEGSTSSDDGELPLQAPSAPIGLASSHTEGDLLQSPSGELARARQELAAAEAERTRLREAGTSALREAADLASLQSNSAAAPLLSETAAAACPAPASTERPNAPLSPQSGSSSTSSNNEANLERGCEAEPGQAWNVDDFLPVASPPHGVVEPRQKPIIDENANLNWTVDDFLPVASPLQAVAGPGEKPTPDENANVTWTVDDFLPVASPPQAAANANVTWTVDDFLPVASPPQAAAGPGEKPRKKTAIEELDDFCPFGGADSSDDEKPGANLDWGAMLAGNAAAALAAFAPDAVFDDREAEEEVQKEDERVGASRNQPTVASCPVSAPVEHSQTFLAHEEEAGMGLNKDWSTDVTPPPELSELKARLASMEKELRDQTAFPDAGQTGLSNDWASGTSFPGTAPLESDWGAGGFSQSDDFGALQASKHDWGDAGMFTRNASGDEPAVTNNSPNAEPTGWGANTNFPNALPLNSDWGAGGFSQAADFGMLPASQESWGSADAFWTHQSNAEPAGWGAAGSWSTDFQPSDAAASWPSEAPVAWPSDAASGFEPMAVDDMPARVFSTATDFSTGSAAASSPRNPFALPSSASPQMPDSVALSPQNLFGGF